MTEKRNNVLPIERMMSYLEEDGYFGIKAEKICFEYKGNRFLITKDAIRCENNRNGVLNVSVPLELFKENPEVKMCNIELDNSIVI